MFEYMTSKDYAIAKSNGISQKIAYERFKNYNWTKQRAITEEVGKKTLWDEHKEEALKNNVSYQMFRRRIKKGESPEMAVKGGKWDRRK